MDVIHTTPQSLTNSGHFQHFREGKSYIFNLILFYFHQTLDQTNIVLFEAKWYKLFDFNLNFNIEFNLESFTWLSLLFKSDEHNNNKD